MNRINKSLCLSALLSLAGTATAQVATALLVEGGPIPGAPAETVSGAFDLKTNDVGGYAVRVIPEGSDPTEVYWGNPAGGVGTVLRAEDTLGGLQQILFLNFGLTDSGSLLYQATVQPSNRASLWVDDAPFAVEGDPIPSLAGSDYGFLVFQTLAGNDPVFNAFASTGGIYLLRGTNAQVLFAPGDAIPGLPKKIDFATNPGFSGNGTNLLVSARLSGGRTALVLNGKGLTIDGSLVIEDDPVPVAAGGLANDVWSTFQETGTSNAGHWFFVGAINADTDPTDILVQDGNIDYRGGDVVDGRTLGPTSHGTRMNESDDLLLVWSLTPNLPGGGGLDPVDRGLFLNGMLLLETGDLVDLDQDLVAESELLEITDIALSERLGDGSLDIYFKGTALATALQAGGPAGPQTTSALFHMNVQPPECFLVIGPGPGDEAFSPGGHTFLAQVSSVTNYQPVLLEDLGEILLPTAPPTAPFAGTTRIRTFDQPRLISTFSAQVLMYNPLVFPLHPEQYTHPLRVAVFSDGSVRTRTYGTGTGMQLSVERTKNEDGEEVLRFPFTIPGF